jgi:hypothetical protein
MGSDDALCAWQQRRARGVIGNALRHVKADFTVQHSTQCDFNTLSCCWLCQKVWLYQENSKRCTKTTCCQCIKNIKNIAVHKGVTNGDAQDNVLSRFKKVVSRK